MMFYLLLSILFISVIVEGSLSVLPLVMISLLLWVVLGYSKQALVGAFLAGLLLDVFLLRTSGLSGVFFIMFVFIITLYQRKLEIRTFQFVLFSSFFGSLTYLYLFRVQHVFILAVISAIVSILLFSILRKVNALLKKQKSLQYAL